jgi:U3 small nucleolar RNA-associated protein 21
MHVTSAVEKRLPPLLDVVSSQARELDWANVLTCHVGARTAYTWETRRRALAPHSLTLASPGAVTAVAISPCGNFGYLGAESGAIEKFNLQSGMRRATTKSSTHDGPVRGVAVDPLGREVYSAGADGFVTTWAATDLKSTRSLDASAPIALLRSPRDSTLLATVCDDVTTRVFDMSVHRLVRVLTGHTNTITDAAWSADGRWLLTTALDATIRIVDVPSGSTIGW